MPRVKQPKTPPVNDFSRGYFCAVAVALKEEGTVTTRVQSLFDCGGGALGAEVADPQDRELFREHGLM